MRNKIKHLLFLVIVLLAALPALHGDSVAGEKQPNVFEIKINNENGAEITERVHVLRVQGITAERVARQSDCSTSLQHATLRLSRGFCYVEFENLIIPIQNNQIRLPRELLRPAAKLHFEVFQKENWLPGQKVCYREKRSPRCVRSAFQKGIKLISGKPEKAESNLITIYVRERSRAENLVPGLRQWRTGASAKAALFAGSALATGLLQLSAGRNHAETQARYRRNDSLVFLLATGRAGTPGIVYSSLYFSDAREQIAARALEANLSLTLFLGVLTWNTIDANTYDTFDTAFRYAPRNQNERDEERNLIRFSFSFAVDFNNPS